MRRFVNSEVKICNNLSSLLQVFVLAILSCFFITACSLDSTPGINGNGSENGYQNGSYNNNCNGVNNCNFYSNPANDSQPNIGSQKPISQATFQCPSINDVANLM